jgi:hypothetical protein
VLLRWDQFLPAIVTARNEASSGGRRSMGLQNRPEAPAYVVSCEPTTRLALRSCLNISQNYAFTIPFTSISCWTKSAANTTGVRRRPPTRRKSTPEKQLSNRSTPRARATAPGRDRRELALRLQEVARTLNVIYSRCVIGQMALKGQNAEQDCDVLAMLRVNVADPVSRQAERLDSIARSLAK